jgi:aldehyde dehydrogenase (NAD(P)+)
MNEPQLAESLAILQAHKNQWAGLPVRDKLTYLRRLREKSDQAAERWVNASVFAKRIPARSNLVGEEWTSGPWAMLHTLNGLIRTFEALVEDKSPLSRAGPIHTRLNGQVVVQVFPLDLYDRLLLSGVAAEVWMQPGVTEKTLDDTVALAYRQPVSGGKVALVLGAGNVSSIAPLDLLYKLFGDGQVCLVKMSPVNDYLGSIFEDIFSDLVEDGFVRFAYGGADVGAFLAEHPSIDEVHMTGSRHTHDTIVFGPGVEGEERRKRNAPRIDKRITSELSGVCPTVVLPGPWSEADLSYQAENIATQKFHNCGFNCVALQVLVLPAAWDQSAALMDALRATVRAMPSRSAYYPGAAERLQVAIAAHPEAELVDQPENQMLPRVLIADIDPDKAQDICFTEEFFGSVLAQTSLPGASAAEYLQAAVQFVNAKLVGSLAVNLLIHPATARELGSRLDDAIAEFHYGTVAVNVWSGLGYLLSQTPWGAYPGNTIDAVESGIGFVHNTFLFGKAQKSIVRAPFYPFPRNLPHGELHMMPKPPWFVTNRTAATTGRRLTRFTAHRSVTQLPALFASALRG